MKKTALCFVCVLSCGCASLPGQVTKANFYSMPQFSPVGIPNSERSGIQNPKITAVLGDVIIGNNNLSLLKHKRGFLYYKDPEFIYTSSPNSTPISTTTGYLVKGASTFESSVGITLKTSKVKIDNIDVDVDVSANNNFEIKNINSIYLDMSNKDYISSLISTAAGNLDVYFVHKLLIADFKDNSTTGIKLKVGQNDISGNVQAALSSSYTGVGVIVGAQYAKLVSRAYMSTSDNDLKNSSDQNCKIFREKLSNAIHS